VPGLQVYDNTPFAFNVALFPRQMLALLTVIVGREFTRTVDVAEAEQRFASVPVTV
jgi:hypothetical protein